MTVSLPGLASAQGLCRVSRVATLLSMETPKTVFLFTDFGTSGPYVGQLFAAVLAVDTRIPVVDLMHDAPAMRPDLAAYLLPAVCRLLPEGAIVVAVVDPGVGSDRQALIVETGALTLIGPDNGLMARMPDIQRVSRIDWQPRGLSTSFHGRDLFAPVAAQLAIGGGVASSPLAAGSLLGADWPDNLAQVIHIDAYGNAMTGLSAEKFPKNRKITIAGRCLAYAPTFSTVPHGEPFWYANSQGLVEVAVNRGSAAMMLSLALGDGFLID